MSQTKKENKTTNNGAGQESQYGLDLILDIDLNVSVELGKVKMPVRDLLQLGQGSIVELAKSVGEPLDIYVNNTLIAKGEVVILDEKFGIRVADIINPVDRIKSLS